MLQVLTGSAKGRKLKVPGGLSVRPTTGRVKQSIFDSLGGLVGIRVLDVFSGTGTLGIEALSRGAKSATFIEKSPRVFRFLKENVESCGFRDRSTLILSHYEGAIRGLLKRGESFDLIFIDPPYPFYLEKSSAELIGIALKVMDRDGMIVIKHTEDLDNLPNGLENSTKSFGDTKVSFVRRSE